MVNLSDAYEVSALPTVADTSGGGTGGVPGVIDQRRRRLSLLHGWRLQEIVPGFYSQRSHFPILFYANWIYGSPANRHNACLS